MPKLLAFGVAALAVLLIVALAYYLLTSDARTERVKLKARAKLANYDREHDLRVAAEDALRSVYDEARRWSEIESVLATHVVSQHTAYQNFKRERESH